MVVNNANEPNNITLSPTGKEPKVNTPPGTPIGSNLKATLTPYDIAFPIVGDKIKKPIVRTATPPKPTKQITKQIAKKPKEPKISYTRATGEMRSALLANDVYRGMKW